MAFIIYTLALVGSFILICGNFLDGIKTFLGVALILFISIYFFPEAADISAFLLDNAMYIFAALLFLKLSEKSGAAAGVIAAGAVILFDIVFI